MTASRPVPGVPGAFASAVDRLPAHLPEGRAYSPIGELTDTTMLLTSAGVGRFRVSSNCIDYVAEPDADPMLVDRFLWGSARSALIHLRGELPLHAAVVTRPGSNLAVALCGVSGAGKSSAAAALAQVGWQTIADDQARLTFPASSIVEVWPGPPLARLCPDTCASLAIDSRGLAIDADDRAKRLLPLSTPQSPCRLAAVIELGQSLPPGDPRLLSRAEALATLSRHVVGPRKWHALRTPLERFNALNILAGRVPILQFSRHRDDAVAVTASRIQQYVEGTLLS